MLVLSRKSGESIFVGGGDSGLPLVEFTVIETRGDKVRIGIEAPKNIPINRSEVHEKILEEQA